MLERLEGRETRVLLAVATCALIPIAVYAVYRFVKSREDDVEEPDIQEETQLEPVIGVEKPDIFSVLGTTDRDGDIPPDGIKAFWPETRWEDGGTAGLVQNLWSKEPEEESDVEEANEKAAEVAPNTIITKKDWLELRELDGYEDHAATYFWEDDIFAGVDNQLDILDKEESFGGIPAAAYDEAMDKGGAYVLCGDGKTLLEIYGSDGNYLEELKAVYAGENAVD